MFKFGVDSTVDEEKTDSYLALYKGGDIAEKITLVNAQMGKMVPFYIFQAIKQNFSFAKVIDDDTHVQEKHLKLYFQIKEQGGDAYQIWKEYLQKASSD